MSDRVLVGRITGAHGLKGEVKVASFTAQPRDIAAYGPLTNSDGSKTFVIASFRTAGNSEIIARLSNVADRGEAEGLRGCDLYVHRSALPLTGDNEYYHADLIGLLAVSVEGEDLGTVVAIQNYGAGDLLEIRAAGRGKSELIPFEETHVPTVDLAAGCVTIVKPVYEEPSGTETE